MSDRPSAICVSSPDSQGRFRATVSGLASPATASSYWRNAEQAEKFLADMTAAYPERKVTLHSGNIGVPDDGRRVIQPAGGGTSALHDAIVLPQAWR